VPRPVYLPVAHVQRCVVLDIGIDMVLVIDSSSSMAGRTRPYGPSKLGAAAAAAGVVVDLLDYDKDRVAVVQFNDKAAVLTGLTDVWAVARGALERITTQPGTRIDAGLDAARGVLQASTGPEGPGGRGREGRTAVVVLLTDGRPTRSRASLVVVAAERLKSDGVTLYTVGLGPDTDPDLLLVMASSAATYFHAPGTDELAQVYREIAHRLVCR